MAALPVVDVHAQFFPPLGFLGGVELSPADRERILGGTACRLLGLG